MTRETDLKTTPPKKRFARLDAAQVQVIQIVLAVVVLILSTALGRAGLISGQFTLIGQSFGAFWVALATMQLVQAMPHDNDTEGD